MGNNLFKVDGLVKSLQGRHSRRGGNDERRSVAFCAFVEAEAMIGIQPNDVKGLGR